MKAGSTKLPAFIMRIFPNAPRFLRGGRGAAQTFELLLHDHVYDVADRDELDDGLAVDPGLHLVVCEDELA